MKALRNFNRLHPTIFSLLLLTLFTIIAYLPLIPFMGFYSDDFFFGYVAHFYGIDGIIKSLIVDRPFNGYLLILNYIWLGLGDNIFLWHIYIFLIRLIGGYILFFTLLKIWPRKLFIVTSIVLLFLIYPGFLQQPLPLGFGNWVTNLVIWVVSLFFTTFALKSKHRLKLILFTLIAVVFQINVFLQLEFFIGMEAFRLLVISYILQNKISFKAFKKTLIYWLPYVISLLIFVFWRILIFKSTREVTDINWVARTYYSNPVWIIKIPLEIINSFIQTVVSAYFLPTIINFIRLPIQAFFISILSGGIAALILQLYFKVIPIEKSDKKLGKDLFFIGAMTILVALIPIIISGRFVRMTEVFDRYTITSTIGVGFLVIGFLLYKIPAIWQKLFITLLVFLSITSHLMNGFYRADNWNKQKDLWWQLYWRTPQIKDNAMLILNFPPVTKDRVFKDLINKVQWNRFYWVDYQIWAPGNFFFNYHNPPKNHFSGDFLTDKSIIDKIKNQTVETYTDRNISILRDFNNTVVIATPSDTSCLWVLDKNNQKVPSYTNELLKSSIIYSDADKLVKSNIPIQPPPEMFGNEPAHNWCYYFEQASLAWQLKDWDKLSKLKQEVVQKNLKPEDPNEWWPFEKDPSNSSPTTINY